MISSGWGEFQVLALYLKAHFIAVVKVIANGKGEDTVGASVLVILLLKV